MASSAKSKTSPATARRNRFTGLRGPSVRSDPWTHLAGDDANARRHGGVNFCTGARPDIPTRQKPCSDEGERQQAGAEQGHSTRSQGQEAIGNQISIAHDTPSDLNARPNCLRLSERATSIEAIHVTRRGQTRERIPSNACARKIPAPIRAITAVIVSNIANVLCAPRTRRRRWRRCTVKKIQGGRNTMACDRGFSATGVPKGAIKTAV